ncbi:hypothetical protein BGZ46_005346 [Entomortierella lignicola]|nr:hypothetical protein BGZ46_005346 [Entomortierella lignicola]
MRTAQFSRSIRLSSRNGSGRFSVNENEKLRSIHSWSRSSLPSMRAASVMETNQRYWSTLTPLSPNTSGRLFLTSLLPQCNSRIYPFHNRVNSIRGLMTQSNGQDPLLKYSEENDGHTTPQEYRLRIGKALRTLQDELPQFFEQGLCTTSIYASNIRLIEASHTNVSMQGKPIYFLLAGAVRWSFKMWFRDLEFEIQSIRVNDRGRSGLRGMDSGSDFNGTTTSYKSLLDTSNQNVSYGFHQHSVKESPIDSNHHHWNSQKSDINVDLDHIVMSEDTVGSAGTGNLGNYGEQPSPPATTVTVRWTMKGTTRPSVVLTSAGPTPPPPSSYAGVFVYQFNDYGFIDEHRIENIMPSPSPEAIQRAFAWWGWLLGRTRPATAAASGESEVRKRLGLGYITNK